MPVESAGDRATMLDDWETATIGGSSVAGHFNNDFTEIDGGQIGVASRDPKFLCRTADVSTVAKGDSVVIGSVTYQVTDIQPDETNDFTMLLLEDQS